MTDVHGNSQVVRVLIADDQRIICEGIASLLSLQQDITVVGLAFNGQEAIERAVALQPDVILMDLRMPIMGGIAATAAIRTKLPTCKVLVLTTFDDDTLVLEALQAGAAGYLLKDIPAADLAQAIRAVQRGLALFDPSIAGKVVAALQAAAPADPVAATELSPREMEVLRLVARGASNREIARALVISEGTVKAHISNILGRLGLRDRTQAALVAQERGWV